MPKKETTRDEPGVAAAEESLATDMDEMFGNYQPENSREENTDDPYGREGGVDGSVEDKWTEGISPSNAGTAEEDSEPPRQRPQETSPSASKAEAQEPQSREEEPEGQEEVGEEEGQEPAPELTQEQYLQATNMKLMEALEREAEARLNGPPQQFEEIEPEPVMADDPGPIQEPPVQVPAFTGIRGADLVAGLTEDELYQAQSDTGALRQLLAKVAGTTAGAASENARIGIHSVIDQHIDTKGAIDNFFDFAYNGDIRSLKKTVTVEALEVESRNPDMSSMAVLEKAGDNVRARLEMSIPDKTEKGGTVTKVVRGREAGVKPAQPRFAKATTRRSNTGGVPDVPKLSDIEQQISEMHKVGGGPDVRHIIR